MKPSRVRLIATLAVLATLPAYANDGGIELGGSPKLLKGHRSVSMESEFVKIDVQTQSIVVDVTFVFKNHGKATTVRMGFPDQGENAYSTEEGADRDVMKTPPTECQLDQFQSWVNGKEVKTQLIRADKPGYYWHAKYVTFKAGETIRVRDRYVTDGGGQVTEWGSLVRMVPYMLHTGASWYGPLGKTEVEITMRDKQFPGPYRTVRKISNVYRGKFDKKHYVKPGTILYWGPSKATLRGNVIRIERTGYEPTERDDVMLMYVPKRPKELAR